MILIMIHQHGGKQQGSRCYWLLYLKAATYNCMHLAYNSSGLESPLQQMKIYWYQLVRLLREQ